ncbi:discoidin domain-containing protein [Cohnella mopanensis]|uniref:discoidin domain-containing protein n=1 Tax=Cohnella mopanensis TaxID=2911966 RepID=UPI001EF9A343|nr:discoidin domain-containing protein [Cohnella mopanensis]
MLKKWLRQSISLVLLSVMTLVLGVVAPAPGQSVHAAGPYEGMYQVTPAPEWDDVFNNTNHGGDDFQWIPFGIKNRQGEGTASTKSAILFADSYINGNFIYGSSMGQYTGITANKSLINWFWGPNGQKQSYNPMWGIEKAESGYSGTVAWNLVSGYGMSGIRNTSDTHDTDYRKMWLSDRSPSAANSYIIFDAYATKSLGKMYIWNFNEPSNTSKGLKNIKVFTSTDGVNYTEFTGSGYPFQIPQASGTAPTAYSKMIDLNSTAARYVKFTFNPVSNDGNWGNPDMYGLSAVRIYDDSGKKLVLSAKAGSTVTRNLYPNNQSWNESAISLGNYVYFVLHGAAGCCTPYEANATQLMRYTINNGAIDFNSLTAFDGLPLAYYPDIPSGFSPNANDARVGNTYRVKQFENLSYWEDDDGYIYALGADESFTYGAWNEYSKLLLSRVPKNSFEDFNAREYWNGTGWTSLYETAANLKDVFGNDVGPVGNNPGFFKAQGGQLDGKYVLVYMEGVDGSSFFRVADHPWGPWSDKNLLYARNGNEHIYNTGAVPFISQNGEFYFYLIKDEHTMKFFKYSEGKSVKGPNLALNKAATADSVCDPSESAAKAVDGSVINNSKWCSKSNNRWLQVDLGSVQQVNQFVIKHSSEGGESASYNTKAYNIQVSNDGTNWSTVINVSNNTSGVTTDNITSTSARYIKLNITTPTQTTDPAARIYEFEVYGPRNLALNKAATADSSCDLSESAPKAVDGSVINNSKWCSKSNNRWLQVDLGAAQQVNRFVIKHSSEGGESASYNTKAYNIQISNDGTNWNTVVNVSNNTSGITVDNITAISARYIKLNVTTPTQTTDAAARIYEFEVYGPSS